ncbi:class D beta-lactamase [Puia dinghuensis]|uniref:Penicillin-binding protein transpeptidase domain-containing protein n=1 Tax=Puia dinghuensis TaxID=1792502 RepID=A0A8J2UF16_9BACT|nr:class D beta-lactamase [Puia dinghuensis]GGB08904.1 hypothetical protein GCM10011511_35520 [Puia dinghuensis]
MFRSLLAIILIPVFFTACSTNNVTVDESLKNYFDSAGIKGCFGLYDNGQGHFTIYNLPRFRDSAYAPGATFDILQSLIAFQTGTLKDDKALLIITDTSIADLAHPGQKTVLRRGVTVTEAFRTISLTNDAVFNRIADSLGKDSVKKWVDSLQYGNKDLNGPDSTWEDYRLKITSDEQLGLVKKLYFDQLPFFKRSHELVRAMMSTEGNSNYNLSYKIGRVSYADGHVLGWVLGWIEENKHPYFFVLNFESSNGPMDVSAVGLQVVKNILRSMGFFNGKK